MGVSLKQEKPPRLRGLLSSLAPEKRAHADPPSVRPYLYS